MRLPSRPANIEELQERISSGEFRESRALEFKREFPKNPEVARQIAGLAAEGGVLVIGVAEEESALAITPIEHQGLRERVEQIGRDNPRPAVQVESHVLEAETTGLGVLWIEVPASPAMLHEVAGTYYARDDTQTRPMRDAEVEDRMKLRANRQRLILEALAEAREREQPTAPSLHARTCIVARPIGATENEFYESTRGRDAWDDFAFGLLQPQGLVPATPIRYWGKLSQAVVSGGPVFQPPTSVSLFDYRDIEFQENGSFAHLSYSQDWYRANGDGVFPLSALRACREAISLITAVQDCTDQRRAWDMAFSISGVGDRTARSNTRYFPQDDDEAFSNYNPMADYHRPLPIPRDEYMARALGVSTHALESEPGNVVRDLTDRFVNECGFDFEVLWGGEPAG